MTEDSEASVPIARRAPQHVRLFPVDDAYEHLCILTLLPSLGPLHLMLADALSPHGSNATLASVGTLSEGFERFVTLPALPRRLRAMGRTVWISPPLSNNHSNSFQVATRDTGFGGSQRKNRYVTAHVLQEEFNESHYCGGRFRV